MGEIVPNGSRLTKKQHYIPQVYLRGFSPEYSRKRENYSKGKYTIYCHNINGKKQCLQAVPIKSICYNENLYEITGNQGEMLLPNYLERFFSAIEISSELCLFLFGGEYKEHYPKNFLFSINDEMQEVIFKAMVSSSFENIFSNHCLDKIERRYIKEVMRESKM